MFQIVIKEMKEFFRDKTNLFFFLMFPIALIFLLGNLLTSMDQAEEAIGKIDLQYMIQTENPYQVMAINNFIQAMSDNQIINFYEAKDVSEAKKLAGKDKITALIIFQGDPLEINIYEGSSHVKNRTVGALMNGFIQTNQSIMAVLKTTPTTLVLPEGEERNYIEQKNLGVNRTMIDYYAVSMLAMISFMSMLLGAGAFVGERQNKTMNRLIIAPQSRVFLFLQKILGMVPQVAIQIAVIMLISVFVFQANYAATLQNNLYLFFMFFIFTLSMIAVGSVVGIIIKTNPMIILMPILWIMMFFGGTYSKQVYVKGFTELMPIYQLQQAAFDLAVFGRFGKANIAILIFFAILIVALGLGAYLFSKKEEER